jgi:hypothetical protein
VLQRGCIDARLEGWLSRPNKQSGKKFGWSKVFVVSSNKTVLFYDSENTKVNSEPSIVLEIE